MREPRTWTTILDHISKWTNIDRRQRYLSAARVTTVETLLTSMDHLQLATLKDADLLPPTTHLPVFVLL